MSTETVQQPDGVWGGRLAVAAAAVYVGSAAVILTVVVLTRAGGPAGPVAVAAAVPRPAAPATRAPAADPELSPPARSWPGLIPTAWAVTPSPADEGTADRADDRPDDSRAEAAAPAPLPPPDRPTPLAEARRGPPPGPAHYVGELQRVPEIGLHTFGAAPARFRQGVGGTRHPMLELFDGREDLRGLPVLRGAACELSPGAARALDTASTRLRASVGTLLTGQRSRCGGDTLQTRSANTITAITAVRPSLLVWVLQTEADPLRESMLELFGRTSSPAAAQALAHRALFEPDPGLRKMAVTLLKQRSPARARPVLLAALRYPWPTAADHAAATLAAINDRDAVPALVQLLDAPDPSGPLPGDDGTPVMRELMRVNHFRNCQLCHAPSWVATDLVRAPVPSPGLPLPTSFPSRSGYGQGRALTTSSGEFVRADVTYLRPDFSMALPVTNPGPWPAWQRYDFFVRTRPAQPWELERAQAGGTYPQREAVLRALRRLTGQDFGDQTADWRAGLNQI
jgi:hypothetical protein